MTSDGSPFTRLRRAITTGNVTIAWAAAAELPRVPLPEALGLCLILRDTDPERFDRAIVRWHARFCLEVRGIGVGEAQLALAALRGLRGPELEPAARALGALCGSRGMGDAERVVEEWLDGRT